LLEVRVIKDIQHFRLEREAQAFAQRYTLRQREIVVPVLRSVQPNTLPDGPWRRVRSNVNRVRSATDVRARRCGKVLGINERDLSRSRYSIYTDRALQLGYAHAV